MLHAQDCLCLRLWACVLTACVIQGLASLPSMSSSGLG